MHELAFCQEFWYLTPMERHQKLLPGSLCKHCLGPLTLCSPNGKHCSNQVPEELICSGCRRKGDEWGQPPLNVLFCTKTDPEHEKQTLDVIVKTAEKLLGGWDMKTQTKLVSIDYPAAGFVYRAYESLSAIKSLHLVDDPVSCVPSFDTRIGEEISVPASYVVLEP